MSYDADVIIIGAGVSGLRAAANLDAMGITYLILEGSDYIGGRLKSYDFEGTTIELGANWVHGATDANPIYDIAVNELGLKGVDNNGDVFKYKDIETGKDFSKAANAAFDELYEIEDQFEDLDLEDGDINLRDALDELGWEQPTSGPREVAEWITFMWNNAGAIEETSVIGGYEREKTEEDFGPDDFLIADPKGFDSVIDYLLDEIDADQVYTEHKVTEINRSEEMVTVVTD